MFQPFRVHAFVAIVLKHFVIDQHEKLTAATTANVFVHLTLNGDSLYEKKSEEDPIESTNKINMKQRNQGTELCV